MRRVRRLLAVLPAATHALVLPPLVDLDQLDALRAAHYFSPQANWLVPGRILCGRYPGSCPSRPVDAETQRDRLAAIREHASTFVCLQSELVPQDASWPSEGIAGQSGNAIAPQTAKFQPYAADAGSDASFVYYGIPDRSVFPSVDALEAVVSDLRDRVLLRDERLYIHCWGGRGRTGLVAACLLGALYDDLVEAEEALARVHRYYRLREPEKGGKSPETAEQCDQVRDWYYANKDLWTRGRLS